MMHGLYPTKVNKYYTNKGPVQSEILIPGGTIYQKFDVNRIGDSLLETEGLNLYSYIGISESLCETLPKKIREQGLLYLRPPVAIPKKVFGFNAMTSNMFHFTFNRPSLGYYFNSTNLAVVENDVIKNNGYNSNFTGDTYQLSNTSQNLFKYSLFQNASAYSMSGTISNGKATLECSSGGSTSYVYNVSYNTTVGKTYTLTGWIISYTNAPLKPTTSYGDATGDFCFIVNGTIVSDLSKTSIKGTIGTLQGNPIYAYSATWTATSTNSNIGFARSGNNVGVSQGGGIDIVAMQLEEGSAAHDIIGTQGSSVIQPADQLSLDMNCLGFDEWTIYLDFSYQRTNDTQPCYIVSTNSTPTGSYLYSRGPGDMSTHMGFHGGIMSLTNFPENTRQRLYLKYSKTRDPRGPYCAIQREGKDSEDNEWRSGSPNTVLIPFNNHLEFFTGPGFVSAELKAFVIFDKWMDFTEDDLNDI